MSHLSYLLEDGSVETSTLLRKGILLEYATIAWGLAGATATLVAGIAVDSIALIGFGLAAVLGAVSAGLIVWQLRHPFLGRSRAHEHAVYERRALFVAGVSFFLLSLYVLSESGSRLYYGEKTEAGIAGLILAVVLLLVAAVLAVMKSRTAKVLESRVARAGASMTLSSVYLSLILLLGFVLHLWHKWWWADPVAALLMIPGIAWGGWEAVNQSKESA